jgi:hypothetical protein
MVDRRVRCICFGPGGCSARAHAAGQFVYTPRITVKADQPPEIEQETLFETYAPAGGADARSHYGDSVRAGTRRLLSRRSQRQVGFGHCRGDAKVPVVQRPRFYRQARRPDAAKAWPRFGHCGSFGAQTRCAKVLLDALEFGGSAVVGPSCARDKVLGTVPDASSVRAVHQRFQQRGL